VLLDMERELTLRIVLEKPPGGVDFALQRGRGSDYGTIQTQRSAGKDLEFTFTVRVTDYHSDGAPNFLGPFVQGPPAERFVYLDIGACAGQLDSCWSRRLKIPLRGITWTMIDELSANSDAILEARVPGTGRDGGPACATVKPFTGWNLNHKRRSSRSSRTPNP
jgi:uncharacterized protein DUF5990